MKSNSNHIKLRSIIRENIISLDKDFHNLMLEREFNQIFDGLYSLLKENGKWTSPNTYEWDPETKNKTYINSRAAWWNDQDWHGGERIMEQSYSLRIDGKFTNDFRKKLGIDHLENY